MNINMDDLPVFAPTLKHQDPNNTLVIDNGTFKCKAGFQSNSPQMIFKNKLYKYKDTISLQVFPLSSIKTMFEKDLVINAEIFECTIDLIIKHLYKIKDEKELPTRKSKKHKSTEIVEEISIPTNLILTHAIDTPKALQSQLLSLLFDVYGFEKIQFGCDAFYSYLYNSEPSKRSKSINNEHDLIISFGHNNTIVYLIQDEKIINYYKIPFGGQLASDYLATLVNNKYTDVSYKIGVKEAEHLVKFLEVSIDYKTEVVEKYNSMKNGNLEKIVSSRLIKYITEEAQTETKTKKIVAKSKNIIKQATDMETMISESNTEIATDDDENRDIDYEEHKDDEKNEGVEKINYLDKDDGDLSKEQLKEKRRQRMIFYSSIYRYKQKVEKELRRGRLHIEYLEEELEKSLDINKYIEKIKIHYKRIKREIVLRENTKRELKNKRSIECLVLMKANNGIALFEPEQKMYNKIQESGDEELGETLQAELLKYYKILEELEPSCLYETTPISVLRGDHINLQGFCVDIELLRTAEVLFHPSIIGMTQPGLTEIFEELRHLKITNVLLTGGFSQISKLDERIKYELNQNSIYGPVCVKWAKDPENDSFSGAKMHKSFPIYDLKTYKEIGAEKMIENMDVFC